MKQHLKDAMKTVIVGAIGGTGTITLAHYNEWMAAVIATLTAVYLAFKCVDWISEKIFQKLNKPTHQKHHNEDD